MASGTAVSAIAAMATPALLILASVSLVASALVRMARIVDRVRVLAAATGDGSGGARSVPHRWLDRHAARARYAESSIALLYVAIVVFTATCLSIAVDRAAGAALGWLPVWLATGGTVFLLAAGACMVVESRLSWDQIQEEIGQLRTRLGEGHG